MGSNFDFFEIYTRYYDIVSRNCLADTKALLSILSESLESIQVRKTIFEDIYKLMSCLDLSVTLDSRQFSLFYDFVFFVCRENGQKNIAVSRAITAWKLVLNGRFRLLNQWCEFVEEHHKYNVSEDTWQQILAFSRCVNEDLEGYDPQGAWPVIIDEFVDHMYSINESRNYGFMHSCGCNDMGPQPSISCTFNGLNLHAGSKRRCHDSGDQQAEGTPKNLENSKCSSRLISYKRLKQHDSTSDFMGHLDNDLGTVDTTSLCTPDTKSRSLHKCLHASACAADDSLSKCFDGYLSIGSCLQLDQKSSVYI